jgi:hypothetical protein
MSQLNSQRFICAILTCQKNIVNYEGETFLKLRRLMAGMSLAQPGIPVDDIRLMFIERG